MIQCHRTYCKSRGFFLLPKLLIFSCQQLTAFDVIAARSLAVTICSSPHPSARQRLLPARFLPGPFPGCALHPPAARTFLPLPHHWLATGHTWPSQTCAGPLVAPFPVGKQREHSGMSHKARSRAAGAGDALCRSCKLHPALVVLLGRGGKVTGWGCAGCGVLTGFPPVPAESCLAGSPSAMGLVPADTR